MHFLQFFFSEQLDCACWTNKVEFVVIFVHEGMNYIGGIFLVLNLFLTSSFCLHVLFWRLPILNEGPLLANQNRVHHVFREALESIPSKILGWLLDYWILPIKLLKNRTKILDSMYIFTQFKSKGFQDILSHKNAIKMSILLGVTSLYWLFYCIIMWQ